jgi:hypothetical protein
MWPFDIIFRRAPAQIPIKPVKPTQPTQPTHHMDAPTTPEAAAAPAPTAPAISSVGSPLKFIATKAPVTPRGESPRGVPPDSFLIDLIAFGRRAPESIFAPNDVVDDIYARIAPQLGPWQSPLHRRAALLEALRVLAGFESSWNWQEGRDTTAGAETVTEEEAGIWQESANSIVFGMDLKELVLAEDGSLDPVKWQAAMKSDHQFCIEYTARLLRHTVRANGPVVRNEINPCLSKAAVAEFQAILAPSFTIQPGQPGQPS